MPNRRGSSPPAPFRWRPAPERLELAPREIHILAFSLEPAPAREEELDRLLSPDEVARAGRFRFARDRRRFVAGRGGLRTILGRYLKRDAARLRFEYGPGGKPALVGPEVDSRVRFNLSGSRGLGVLAVGMGLELGVDTERVSSLPNAVGLARRNFTRPESDALATLGPGELDEAFFSLWTRKEAVVKCLGRGLSHPMDSFSLTPRPHGAPERILIESPDRSEPRSLWVTSLPEPCEGYVAALAAEGEPGPVTCFGWTSS